MTTGWVLLYIAVAFLFGMLVGLDPEFKSQKRQEPLLFWTALIGAALCVGVGALLYLSRG